MENLDKNKFLKTFGIITVIEVVVIMGGLSLYITYSELDKQSKILVISGLIVVLLNAFIAYRIVKNSKK